MKPEANQCEYFWGKKLKYLNYVIALNVYYIEVLKKWDSGAGKKMF